MNMNTETPRTPAKPTGRKYESVGALMRGEGVSQEVQGKVAEIENETRVTLQLAKLRQTVGLTQEQLAEAMGTTQSSVSKLESGRDEDLTLGQVRHYARATNQRIGLMFGKPVTHVEAVQGHAIAIKHHLQELAKIANQHEELETHIQAFFGDAFFNILNILTRCHEQLPNGGKDIEIRFQVIKSEPSRLTSSKPRSSLASV